MRCAGNVIFHDVNSASKAILGLGSLAPPEEDPDGYGETFMLLMLLPKTNFLCKLQLQAYLHILPEYSLSLLQCDLHVQHGIWIGHPALNKLLCSTKPEEGQSHQVWHTCSQVLSSILCRLHRRRHE